MFAKEPSRYGERPSRVDHVVYKENGAIGDTVAGNLQRTINIARLLRAVGHRLLFRSVVSLGDDHMKR